MNNEQEILTRSWTEDFGKEYITMWYHTCIKCQNTFRGHRQLRTECKKCSNPEEQEGIIRIC